MCSPHQSCKHADLSFADFSIVYINKHFITLKLFCFLLIYVKVKHDNGVDLT